MRSTASVLAAAVLLAAITVPATAHAGGVIARTDSGFVSGTLTQDLRSFQGIPFAAPPVGENRWRDPQPVQPWRGVRAATQPGPRCAQDPDIGIGTPGSDAEDCLYLNVAAPKNAVNRPVVVWVHGGSFKTGSGSEYRPEPLVRNGVVVVTINYRLGAFGFFGYPGLAGSGAFGIADQQAALKWVQRNIRQFGGNPGNVTLFGESAGGLSTCAQLTTPKTAGLFHQAIVQSGPCQLTLPVGGGQYSYFWSSRTVVEQTGATAPHECKDIACFRGLPSAKVRELTPLFSSPAYDTEALPHDPVAVLKQGKQHKVPVLAGYTRDELTVFVVAAYPPLDAQAYEQVLVATFGQAKARQVIRVYPPKGGDEREQLSAVVTSLSGVCTTHELQRQTGGFGYEFAEPNPPMIFKNLPPFRYGAYHASELPFLWGFGDVELTEPQQKLSSTMAGAWTRFASTGRPGWTRDEVKVLATGQVARADYHCDLWSDVVPAGGERQEG